MTAAGPRHYITRSANHEYTFDGRTYPGVTGILKVLDKSEVLMSWAARMTAEAALANLQSLPQLLGSVGPEGVVKALTARSGWKRDESAAIGSNVHEYADLVVRGEPLPEMAPAIARKVANYIEWWNASGWRKRASEAFLVNTTRGYGGTLDLLAYDRDGRTVLADIKTGRGVYRETILQLGAYGASEWLDQHDGGLYAMPEVDRYVVLHVTAKGVREIELSVGEAERQAFYACMELSAWRASVSAKAL